MINLGHYIADVLKQHNEAAVPEIGLFQSARVPASYDKATDSFIPPRRRVTLVAGTGSVLPLAKVIQEQEQVSEEDAHRLISEAVQQVRTFLQNGGSAALKGIGELSLQNGEFLLRATDIPDPGLQPVSRQIFPELPLQTVIPEDTGTEGIVKKEITTGTEPDEPEVAATEERPSRLWIWLLTLIVVAGGAFAVWKYVLQGQRNQQTAGQTTPAVLSDTAMDTAITIDAIADSASHVSDTLAADGTGTTLPDTVKTATGLPPGTVTYEIIIASFKTLPEADEYVNRLNKKGYSMRVIDSKMPGNRKKVSYSSHLKEDDAYQELARVQKQFVADAWLFRLVHD